MATEKPIHNGSELTSMEKQLARAHVRGLNLTQTLQLNKNKQIQKHSRNGAAIISSMQDPNSGTTNMMNQSVQEARNNNMFMSMEDGDVKNKTMMDSSVHQDVQEDPSEVILHVKQQDTTDLNFGSPTRLDKLPSSKGCDASIERTKEATEVVSEM